MKSFYIILIAVLFTAFAYPLAHAATTPAQASMPACTVSVSDVAKISAIQNNPSLSYADEIKQELALRKHILQQIIDCGTNDARTLQSTLQQITVDNDSKHLQATLSSQLDDAVNFYGIEQTKLDGVGIAGSQAVAKELRAWREGTYNPLADEVNNFILWSRNQGLFVTAQTRMDQTAHAVNFLEGISANSDLESAMSAARSSFAQAKNANDAAKNALLTSLPADQSLALIKQSLAALSDTYQKFSAVSDLIKTLIPQ